MEKWYMKWSLEVVQIMLPDDYVSGIVASEDDWGVAISAGNSVLQLGLENVKELKEGQELLKRIQEWLVALLQQGALNRRERVEGGNVLAALGDPRFRKEAWYLPNEPLLGFVEIPEGSFIMGEFEEQHEVTLPTFYIARYPVTKAQFKVFVKDTGFSPGNSECLQGSNNHPVDWVSWDEALEYSNWLSRKLLHLATNELEKDSLEERERYFWTGLQDGTLIVTLPSAAEWEKAARGAEGRRYPWGREKPDLEHANYGACFGEPALGATSPVGCFPRGATPERVHDLAGNVWEYTRTLFGKDPFERKESWIRSYVPRWWTRSLRGEKWLGPEFAFPYDPKDGRENLEAGPEWDRSVRGGSWTVDARRLRCAFRDALPPTSRHGGDGFRVAVSIVQR